MTTFLTPTNVIVMGIGIITLLSLAINKDQWRLFTYYLITLGFLCASYSVFGEVFQNLINLFPTSLKFDEVGLRCLLYIVPFAAFIYCGYLAFKIFKDALKKKQAQKQKFTAGVIYAAVPLIAFLLPRGFVIDTILLSTTFVALYFHDWLFRGVVDDVAGEHKENNEKEVMILLSQIQDMIDRGEGQMWDNFFMRGNILIENARDQEAEGDFIQVINLLLAESEISESKRLYIEKSYARLAQIKARKGDKKGAKGYYAKALSYSNEPQSYVSKMEELEVSKTLQGISVNYKLSGICLILSLILSMCAEQELSTGLIASVESRLDILIGEWQFKTTIEFEENTRKYEGDVEFKEDGTFKRNIKVSEFKRIDFSIRTTYVGGGFITGNYEIIGDENNFIWVEKTKVCGLAVSEEYSSKSYNDIKDLCPMFKLIKYGDIEDRKITKIKTFTRNKILITGANLAEGRKLTYELIRK